MPKPAHLRLCSGLVVTLLAACGGGGETPAAGGPGTAPAAALSPSNPGELTERVKTLLRSRATQRASGNSASIDLTAAPSLAVVAISAGTPAAVTYSNTTVQEAGVDEEDLLKTDGTRVFALDTTARDASGAQQLRLLVHRRQADGRIEPEQTLPLPAETSTYPAPKGLMLAAAASRLAVLSESLTPRPGPLPCPPGTVCTGLGLSILPPIALDSRLQVQMIDLAAGGATLGTKLSIDGRLVASRLVGNVLYLVTTHTPVLPVDQLAATATTEREAQLATLKPADYLPALRIDTAAAQPLLAETDCFVQPRNSSLSLTFTTITAIDLGTPNLTRASRCFAGGTEAAYMSPANLYLATTRSTYSVQPTGRLAYPPQFATDLHKFAFSGLTIDYRASGEVAGHLGWDQQRKSYRMGEANGDLRVLSFTGQTGWLAVDDATAAGAPAPSPATLTILRERATDRSLQVVSTLPNAQRPGSLGKPGEQVYGVRFAGDRAYLVTFRQVDPLYVLDLANPADPRAAGVLEMPGFSDYLYPLPDGLLFGVGKDATSQGIVGGVKVALFDVRDAAQPKIIATRTFGSRGSSSALDHSSHGLNMLMRGNTARIAVPMRLLATDFGSTAAQGLQRFEVDITARTLATLSAIPAPASPIGGDLWGDRSLQIESQVVYLSQGKIVTAPW